MDRVALIDSVKQMLKAELRSTIPPSYDVMRDFRFEHAAEKVVNLVLAAVEKAEKER